MLSLISPAKSLDFSLNACDFYSIPLFQDESIQLINALKRKSVIGLSRLMSISRDLAKLNAERYQTFETDPPIEKTKQAILTFNGDVYRGLEAQTFQEDDLKFAQHHVRILSGLYGILKPMDLIQPYRLEMGTKLKIRRKNNLYAFWQDKLVRFLNEELKNGHHNTVINLASKEYFGAVDTKRIDAKIIHVHFKEYRNDELKLISFNAKRARGTMIKYIVLNRINETSGILDFNLDGYAFDASLSDKNQYTFTR